jgi:hypothetical protein
MKVPSDEIPQADLLADVVKTVIAVSHGAKTFQDISQSIGKVERQGRYYRKAAEIAGLIITPGANNSMLTQLGQEFVRTGPTLSNPILLQGVLNSRIFQRIIPFLESHLADGVTRGEFTRFLSRTADLGGTSMADRRISSVVSWLIELDIVNFSNGRYRISSHNVNTRLPSLGFDNVDEPLFPSSHDLNEYNTVHQRASGASETIVIYKDSVALERAGIAHRSLINLAADRIRTAGGIPKYNQLIDLATHLGNNDYIFEMKSTNESNIRSQIRKGISQLYEYRYLQNKHSAKLILVVEKPLSINHSWMLDYMELDRGINLVWDGNDELFGSERTKSDLEFLRLQ